MEQALAARALATGFGPRWAPKSTPRSRACSPTGRRRQRASRSASRSLAARRACRPNAVIATAWVLVQLTWPAKAVSAASTRLNASRAEVAALPGGPRAQMTMSSTYRRSLAGR